MAAGRMSRSNQGQNGSGTPLASGETVWMEGLEGAINALRQANSDVEIHGVHSMHTDEGEWRVGLRCGAAGISYARIVLDYGYRLEWVD